MMFPLTPLDTSMQSLERAVYDVQSRLLTHALGGLLPGGRVSDVDPGAHLLHLGCGPGSWGIEMAMAHPALRITGLDVHQEMIDEASREAHRRGLHQLAHLHVQSLAGPFAALPTASVDLMTMRCLGYRIPSWEGLLGECARLLRPGGRLHIADMETLSCNAPAHRELMGRFRQAGAVRCAGSLQQELEALLHGQGFSVSCCIQTIDYSALAPLHEEWIRVLRLAVARAGQGLLNRRLLAPSRLEVLLRQHELEMQLPSFQAVQPMLILWGTKTM